MHPHQPSVEIDGRLGQPLLVGGPQPRCEAERRHGAKLPWKFSQKSIGFTVRQVVIPTGRLIAQCHRGRALQPLPIPHALLQNRAYERERLVDPGLAELISEPGLRGASDHVEFEGGKFLAADPRVEPARLRLVFLSWRLARLFFGDCSLATVPCGFDLDGVAPPLMHNHKVAAHVGPNSRRTVGVSSGFQPAFPWSPQCPA